MPLRYAGGKTKALKPIVSILKSHFNTAGPNAEYREPFFGGGSVGLRLLQECPEIRRAWFNDRDPAICSVWECIAKRERDLLRMIEDFEPHVDHFYEFQEELRSLSCLADVGNRPDVAFKKIACHRMSYSGLGTKAGGPMGGRGQKGKYDVGCRYNAAAISKKAEEISTRMARVLTPDDFCTCLDFEQVVRAPGPMVLYLDPPYVEKGPELYQFSFTEGDHRRLAGVLRRESRPWLLSYDKHPLVDALYQGWAHVEDITIFYSGGGARHAVEYLIGNRPFQTEKVLDHSFCNATAAEDALRN